ncbi:hypothetical protein BGX27_011134 [Mortierella sp. AM989]|nr:hypothetical protein BGX27_011134 [Mortierella sp. AM989]
MASSSSTLTMQEGRREPSIQLHSISDSSLPSGGTPSQLLDPLTVSPGTFDSANSSFNTEPITISTDSIELLATAETAYPCAADRIQLEDQLNSLMLDGPRIDILSRLPYEVTTHILHFFDMVTLTNIATVSRAWNQFANDNEVWKRVYLHQQQWKIKTPSQKSSALTSDDEHSQETATAHSSLDWKRLSLDRKALETRWKSTPGMTKLVGHEDSVYCIQFDNTRIVTGSRDHTIKFWDIKTLQCTDTLKGHSQSVLCLQFNDKRMISGSSDSTIIVWDMETHQPISQLYGHTAGVLDVCFNDQYIISCSKDTSIKVWDVQTMALIKTMTGHRGPVNAVQLHQGQIVSASGDGLVKLWDVATGSCVRDFIGHERGLACVQFNGEIIVSGSNDKTIRIWNAATGNCIRVLTGHDSLVRTLHFDQNRIVSGSYDYTVKVWDMDTGECTLDLNNGHVSWVFDVQFSIDRIISSSQDRNIVVWDFAGNDIDTSLFV